MAKKKDFFQDKSPENIFYGQIERVETPAPEAKLGKIVIKLFAQKEEREFTFDTKGDVVFALEEMAKSGIPVIASQREGEEASQYYTPLPFSVAEFRIENTRIEGTFNDSNSIEFYVEYNNPHFDEIRSKIEKSKVKGHAYWFAVSEPTLQLNGTRKYEVKNVLKKVKPIRCSASTMVHPEFDEQALMPITGQHLRELFIDIASRSTDPLHGPLTGIPFLSIENGCEDRCHEICRILIEQRIHPIKVWVVNPTSPINYTSVTGNCSVIWAFHTAPAVLTNSGYRVIDPATHNRPVPVREWYQTFRSTGSQLHYSSHHLYKTASGLCTFVSDPEYQLTSFRLRVYRAKLRLDAQLYGADTPPYEHTNNRHFIDV